MALHVMRRRPVYGRYLVMRHGVVGQAPHRLGCYFCNDVVAPANSTTNRHEAKGRVGGNVAVELPPHMQDIGPAVHGLAAVSGQHRGVAGGGVDGCAPAPPTEGRLHARAHPM